MDRDNDLEALLAELDPVTRTLVAEVDLGEQAKEFARSDLGRHFIGVAMQEIASAQTALATTSPWRFWKVQELQNRIWRANFLLSWIRELVISGRSAHGTIQEAEETING